MLNAQLPYQGISWVLGTTSFRAAKLNLKIERQVLLLDCLREEEKTAGREWNWN